MKRKEGISLAQKEIQIRYSITNIKRSLVLMQRATNTLSFASKSLEGTEGAETMMEEITDSKRSLADAMRQLSKYEEEEKRIC